MMKDFRDFVFRGNVIDMAVGVVMGVAFAAVVNSLVTNLIMSPIAAIFGKPDFSSLVLGPLRYGSFLSSLVQFVLIAAGVFFFVVRPMTMVMKHLGMVKDPPAMRECPACLQTVPAAATKCMYCTIDLTPEAPKV
jgi:large conductance mechanosensitive channel